MNEDNFLHLFDAIVAKGPDSGLPLNSAVVAVRINSRMGRSRDQARPDRSDQTQFAGFGRRLSAGCDI